MRSKKRRKRKTKKKKKVEDFAERLKNSLEEYLHSVNKPEDSGQYGIMVRSHHNYQVLLNIVSFLYTNRSINEQTFLTILEMCTDLKNLQTVELLNELRKYRKEIDESVSLPVL